MARWGAVLAAALVALAILRFYLLRLTMPLPIFATDECGYLIRALFSEETITRNPMTGEFNNGAMLSVIRMVSWFSGSVIVHDRIVNSAVYLIGLLLFWRFSVAGLRRGDQVCLLILTIGFPYYRFAFSNLPEGLFVAVLALFCLSMAWLYQPRPVVQALVGGTLAAILVLIKPHGVTLIAAFAATVVLDAVLNGRRWLAVGRLALFLAAFLAVGNLIQIGAEQPTRSAIFFFVAGFYRAYMGAKPPPASPWLMTVGLGSMLAGSAVLAGPPMLIGLTDLARRWRRSVRGLPMGGRDLVFLLLVFALLATLAMVTIFIAQAAGQSGERLTLWGRYFEFFSPMLWLAAAPAMGRVEAKDRLGLGLGCAALVLAGLAGLLLSFRAGIVIFPWDSSALSAFFYPDPQRAPMAFTTPYRALAVGAAMLAALGLALRVRAPQVGLALTLALAVLSTHLDKTWLGVIVGGRLALQQDIEAIRPTLPRRPGATVFLAANPNDGFLGFFALGGRPRVLIGPAAQATPADLAAAEAVIVTGPDAPPGDRWVQTYKGVQLSAFRPKDAPP